MGQGGHKYYTNIFIKGHCQEGSNKKHSDKNYPPPKNWE